MRLNQVSAVSAVRSRCTQKAREPFSSPRICFCLHSQDSQKEKKSGHKPRVTSGPRLRRRWTQSDVVYLIWFQPYALDLVSQIQSYHLCLIFFFSSKPTVCARTLVEYQVQDKRIELEPIICSWTLRVLRNFYKRKFTQLTSIYSRKQFFKLKFTL